MRKAGNRRVAENSPGAFTLIEFILALGLVSIVSLALFSLMSFSLKAWKSTESRQAALTQLNRADTALVRDLSMTSITQLAAQPVPGLSGKQGDAVWFLSAVNPADGQFIASRESGKPIWQTNVLYYLIQPQQHDQISNGVTCSAVDGGGGYDSGCPHKVLVKKVIDTVVQANPYDESNPETLMTPAQVTAQLNAPLGYSSVNLLSDPGVVPEGASVVARDLLWFRVEPAVPGPDTVTLNLKAVRIDEARKEVRVGAVDLLTSKHTLQTQLQLVPKN